jgi:hypothetical protein
MWGNRLRCKRIHGTARHCSNTLAKWRSLKDEIQMQYRRGEGKPDKAPTVFPSPLPHPPHSPSSSPQRSPGNGCRTVISQSSVPPPTWTRDAEFLQNVSAFCIWGLGRLGEAERGCGGGGRKNLGPYGLSPASTALHLPLSLHPKHRPICVRRNKRRVDGTE